MSGRLHGNSRSLYLIHRAVKTSYLARYEVKFAQKSRHASLSHFPALVSATPQ